MLFSKQVVYCNACGKEMFIAISGSGTFGGRFCSTECNNEFKWKETLSTMGKEYYPKLIKTSTS